MIAAIGAFDGFHRGHQTLLARAADLALLLNTTWSVVTFNCHPDNILGNGGFRFLFLPDEQDLLQTYFGIPSVRRIPFTRTVADMSPAAFLDYIAARYGVSGIVVGEDFRFGKDRGGTLEVLSNECARRGWSLDIMPLVQYRNEPLSSSRIRDKVLAGDMPSAWEMSGYPFFYSGLVIHGDKRGRELGFPTANLDAHRDKVCPATGVYATLAHVDGRWLAGAANVGYNPTFAGERSLRFEVNFLDYDGDLYERVLTIFMLRRLREERRYKDIKSLLRQMTADADNVRLTAAEALAMHKKMWDAFALG